jgi:hypothetical protein
MCLRRAPEKYIAGAALDRAVVGPCGGFRKEICPSCLHKDPIAVLVLEAIDVSACVLALCVDVDVRACVRARVNVNTLCNILL